MAQRATSSALSYSHPEGQSGAPLCVTEHDNCLWMALMPHALQLPAPSAALQHSLQPGAQPSLGQADRGGIIKGPPAPIYQCQHHNRPIIHRTLGPPTGSPCQPGEHRTWRLARKDILRLVRSVGAVSGPCDQSSQMEKVRAHSPAFCPCYSRPWLSTI